MPPKTVQAGLKDTCRLKRGSDEKIDDRMQGERKESWEKKHLEFF